MLCHAPRCGRGGLYPCSTRESFQTLPRSIAEGYVTSPNTEQDKAVRQNEQGTEHCLSSFVYCESARVLLFVFQYFNVSQGYT